MAAHSSHSRLFTLVAAITFLASLLILNSCRSGDNDTEDSADISGQEAPYQKSPLREGQSSFLDSQVDSVAEWQSWHKDLFRQAENERRVVFAILGSGTDPKMLNTLSQMNQSATSMNLIKNNHITSLIDSNLHPDMEYYMALICMNSKMQMNSPILIWFSYNGDLISWTPINSIELANIDKLIQRTSNTVNNLWLQSPEYTLDHSRRDHEARSKISIPKPIDTTQDGTPTLIGPISRVRSLFDPVSDKVDNIENLTAARYINFMVMASNLPEQSSNQRQQCLQTAKRVADKMLIYGLIDPLDGGVFNGYQGVGQNIPIFSKTLRAQALSMSALYQLFQSTKDTKYRDAANRIAAFTEKYLTQDDGSLALGITQASGTDQNQFYFWTLEEIKKSLTAQELDIAIHAFEIKGLGNINLSDDPKKIYFRKNILTWKTTLEDLAKRTSMSSAELSQRLDSISKKLLAARSKKLNGLALEKLTTSGSLATYTSACVSGYRATADAAHLKLAEKTLGYIRDHFIDSNNQLQRASYNGRLNGIPAKAADFALVCQAALDLHEASLKPEWLKFAHQIHTQMNQQLQDPETGFIREFNGEGYPRDYPIYSYYNINSIDNDSTWALANSNAKRLSHQIADDSLAKQIEQLDKILLQASRMYPLSSIDYLTRESMARSARVYLKLPVDDGMLAIARANPCQIVPVNNSGTYPELGIKPSEMKAGSCALFIDGKRIGQASSQQQLKSLFSNKP